MHGAGSISKRRVPAVSAHTRGYTMVEMLVVISIILILSSMTLKGINEMNRVRKLSNSTETVASVISQARRMAISENRIYHVRIENLSASQQYISVYRFKKLTDALKATSEEEIQADRAGLEYYTRGWGDALPHSPGQPGSTGQYGPGQYANELVLRRPLEPGVLFETEYDISKLWNYTSKRFNTTYAVASHPKGSETSLFYVTPPAAGAAYLLPKTSSTPFYNASGNFTGTLSDTVLYFNPDGTAGSNALLLLRDDYNLQFVQVLKGGAVRTGDLRAPSDFGKQIK